MIRLFLTLLRYRAAAFGRTYLRVSHLSPLWVWRGQALILAATLLAAAGVINLIVEIIRAAMVPGASLTATILLTWLIHVIFVVGLAISIDRAHRGEVQLGGILLVVVLAVALTAYPLIVDFTQRTQTIMVSLMFVVVLSGAILGARTSLVVAGGVSLLDILLIYVFHRSLPPYLPSAVLWYDMTLGLLVYLILSPVERWIAEREVSRSPMRVVVDVRDSQGRSLSPEAVAALDEIHLRLQHMLNTLDELCDMTPAMARSERHITTYDPQPVLEGLLQEYAIRLALQGLEIVLDVQPGAPNRVVGSPRTLRRALRRILDRLIQATVGNRLTITAYPAGSGAWEIRITGEAPAIQRSDASLIVAGSLLRTMGGALAVEPDRGKGLLISLSVPVEAEARILLPGLPL